MQNETTLYFYLLSTIAQTLGAILSLLSVFLVFRVQLLENRWERIFERLIEVGTHLGIEYVYLAAENSDVLNSISTRITEYENDNSKKNFIWVTRGKLTLKKYNETQMLIKEIMWFFFILAILTILVIGASIWGLSINRNPLPKEFGCMMFISYWGFFISIGVGLVFILYALRAAPLFVKKNKVQ